MVHLEEFARGHVAKVVEGMPSYVLDIRDWDGTNSDTKAIRLVSRSSLRMWEVSAKILKDVQAEARSLTELYVRTSGRNSPSSLEMRRERYALEICSPLKAAIDKRFKYAILSHRWLDDGSEPTFQMLREGCHWQGVGAGTEKLFNFLKNLGSTGRLGPILVA
jgi:hypothetical protein